MRIGRYAFVTMMDELAFWLLLAFVATGLLAALLPPDFFLRFLPWPLLSMVVMAIVGVPDLRLRERLDADRRRDDRQGARPRGRARLHADGTGDERLDDRGRRPDVRPEIRRPLPRCDLRGRDRCGTPPERGHRGGARSRSGGSRGRGPRCLGARPVPRRIRIPGSHGVQPSPPRPASGVERAEGARTGAGGPRSQHHDERPVPPIARDCRRERPRAPLGSGAPSSSSAPERRGS